MKQKEFISLLYWFYFKYKVTKKIMFIFSSFIILYKQNPKKNFIFYFHKNIRTIISFISFFFWKIPKNIFIIWKGFNLMEGFNSPPLPHVFANELDFSLSSSLPLPLDFLFCSLKWLQLWDL